MLVHLYAIVFKQISSAFKLPTFYVLKFYIKI